ncbi:MAG: hypothetical protein LC799_16695 [Actinobacteria bacterium]|nr:hypothetical protein [Actinomycetota bacterium]
MDRYRNGQWTRGTAAAECRAADLWQRLSNRHFGGRLYRAPTIQFVPPPGEHTYGAFIAHDDGHTEITLDPRLLTGGRGDIDGCAPPEGRWRLIEDTLLHEAVHCAVHRARRWDDNDSHSGAFAILANHISDQLGLPRTRDTWAWPNNVRP